MSFSFRIGEYQPAELQNELAFALQRRQDVIAASKNPFLKNESGKPKAAPPKSKRILGMVMVGLGLAALVATIVIPGRPKMLQIAGILLAGIGVMLMKKPMEYSDVISGKASKAFQNTAAKLLQSLSQSDFSGGLEVQFDEDGIALVTESKSQDVAFSSVTGFVETPKIFLLTYDKSVIVLQKRDIFEGQAAEFYDWFTARCGCPSDQLLAAE